MLLNRYHISLLFFNMIPIGLNTWTPKTVDKTVNLKATCYQYKTLLLTLPLNKHTFLLEYSHLNFFKGTLKFRQSTRESRYTYFLNGISLISTLEMRRWTVDCSGANQIRLDLRQVFTSNKNHGTRAQWRGRRSSVFPCRSYFDRHTTRRSGNLIHSPDGFRVGPTWLDSEYFERPSTPIYSAYHRQALCSRNRVLACPSHFAPPTGEFSSQLSTRDLAHDGLARL